MAGNKFDDATTKLDIKMLERLIKETGMATDRTGKRLHYCFPLEERFTDVIAHVFKKHGVTMEKYNSSLNKEFPILRISLQDIDKLPDESREFLFAINVKPKELEKHFNEIVAEMKQRKNY